MIIKLDGIISGKAHRPKMTYKMKERNGKMTKVPEMQFGLWCEDMTKKPEKDEVTNKMKRPTKLFQVLIPEHKVKLFKYLEPGRRIQVEGRFSNNPKEANGVIYTNDRCIMNDLIFLDSPRRIQCSRALYDLKAAGLIDENQAEEFSKKMEDFYDGKSGEKETPHIIIDETEEAEGQYQG